MKKLLTVRGHTGLARFLSDTSEEPIGEVLATSIPSRDRYAFSGWMNVWERDSKPIVWIEVAHMKYEIWDMSGADIRPVGENA